MTNRALEYFYTTIFFSIMIGVLYLFDSSYLNVHIINILQKITNFFDMPVDTLALYGLLITIVSIGFLFFNIKMIYKRIFIVIGSIAIIPALLFYLIFMNGLGKYYADKNKEFSMHVQKGK